VYPGLDNPFEPIDSPDEFTLEGTLEVQVLGEIGSAKAGLIE
jgi:hypothetical protein